MLARLAKNTLAYIGSSSIIDAGEQPERVAEATDREDQAPDQARELEDQRGLGVGRADAAAVLVLAELVLHVARPCRRTARRGRSGA